MTYSERLKLAIQDSNSTLCVGLDPNLNLLPASVVAAFPDPNEQVVEFCKNVIDVTHPYCAAFKPNLAFFESLGSSAFEVLEEIIAYIPDNRIVIADAKRGDISSTAEHYKIAFFDKLKVDALTVNPLMGFESIDAYSHAPEKAVYVLALTSNPGAADFLTKPFDGYTSLAAYIAKGLAERTTDSSTHLGMVIGATQTDHMKTVLKAHQEGCLLIPGIGSQGGSVSQLTELLSGHAGLPLINSSRSILYSGGSSENWKDEVREAARQTRESLSDITAAYV